MLRNAAWTYNKYEYRNKMQSIKYYFKYYKIIILEVQLHI